VYIPAGEGPAETESSKPASSASHGGREKILVAEDNDALREALDKKNSVSFPPETGAQAGYQVTGGLPFDVV